MKKIIVIIIVGMTVAPVLAQDSTATYSLQAAIDYALENQRSIQNAVLDEQGANAKVKETISIGLPQVNGKIDVMDNLEVQSQFVPANGFDQTAPADLIIPLAFGVQYSSNANLTATQLLFDGTYFVGLQAARVYKELFQKTVIQSKVEVVEAVTKAYYGVLVSQERLTLLQKNQSLIEKLYDDTQVMYQEGFVEKVDLQRIEVAKNNLKVEELKINSLVSVSLSLLKFQMGMPQSEEIVLSDDLNKAVDQLSAGSLAEIDPANRIEHKMLGVQYELMKLDVKNNKSTALPTLAAFGTIGANVGGLNAGDIMKFGDYQTYSMIGLSLEIPVFSSFRRKHRIDQSIVNMKKVENDIQSLEEAIAMEALQTKLALEDSKNALDIQKQNIELAEEVYRVTKLKYTEGLASNYDVINAETSLKEAQTNYYGAIYDAMIAKVDVQKAAGTLYTE